MLFLRKLFKASSKNSNSFEKKIFCLTGLKVIDPTHYRRALKHRSLFPSAKDNYERLEFLGDSLLDVVVSEYLLDRFKDKPEGFLTQIRSQIVSRSSLNEIATKIGIEPYIQYNRDSIHHPENLLGDALEALISAIYKDHGMKGVRVFWLQKILPILPPPEHLIRHRKSAKSQLLEIFQKADEPIRFQYKTLPNGKSDLTFVCRITSKGEMLSEGRGTTKKAAAESAAITYLNRD